MLAQLFVRTAVKRSPRPKTVSVVYVDPVLEFIYYPAARPDMPANSPPSRRRFVRTIGTCTAATITAGTSASAGMNSDDESNGASADESTEIDRYIAVVDRIVDDRYVVLLLEERGEPVGQHVEPAIEMNDVAETDILRVEITDGNLRTYQRLEERPSETCPSA